MTAFWMNVLWSMSSQLYWEKEQGNLALFIMSPTWMMAILLGMALGGLVATTLRALVIILLGSLFFNVQYAVSSFAQLFAVFYPDHGGPIWTWDDVGIPIPSSQP